jgi:hypothetical protein
MLLQAYTNLRDLLCSNPTPLIYMSSFSSLPCSSFSKALPHERRGIHTVGSAQVCLRNTAMDVPWKWHVCLKQGGWIE